MKSCFTCGLEKPRSEYHATRQNKDGLCGTCKPCSAAARSARYFANRGKHNEKVRAWASANKEKRKEITDRWNAKNPQKKRESQARYHLRNRDKVAARGAKWTRENPERSNAKTMRRIAARLCATPKWADNDEIIKFYKLASDLSKERGEPYNVDHIVPLQSKMVCGLHCEFNLQVILGKENSSKSNRYWPEMPGAESHAS